MNRREASRVSGSRLAALAIVIPLVAVPLRSATAQGIETPIHGELSVGFGSYLPDVDGEFDSTGPWEVTFGKRGALLFELEYSHYLWREVGTLAIGVSIGFLKKSGQSFFPDGTASPDETKFRMVPARVSVIYRYDDLPRRWNVPFVPYAELGLDASFWWVTSSGGVATYRNPETLSLDTGQNLTWGWHATLGLQFLLDVLSPSMSRSFDASSGVNNSYLFAEWLYADVDNFGSDESIRVGSSTFMFGLAFEF